MCYGIFNYEFSCFRRAKNVENKHCPAVPFHTLVKIQFRKFKIQPVMAKSVNSWILINVKNVSFLVPKPKAK